jgi:rhodanese-related sulfurtransferase
MSKTLDARQLKERLDSGARLQLVDVRSPGEYASGHIPGTMNLPLEQVEARLDDVQQTDPIVLVCQSGRRAGMCAERLQGHRQEVIILEGGTTAWVDAGLPVVRSTSSTWALERQVRLAAGLLVLIGTILAVTVAPGAIYLAMFVGAGLTLAGLTGLCPMASALALLPWNKPKVHAIAGS